MNTSKRTCRSDLRCSHGAAAGSTRFVLDLTDADSDSDSDSESSRRRRRRRRCLLPVTLAHAAGPVPVDRTGDLVWPAALLLCDYLVDRRRLLVRDSAVVVELGCGAGLPGLVASGLGAPSVFLTDAASSSLAYAAANAAGVPGVHVRWLDWE